MSKAIKPIRRINGDLCLPGDELASHLSLILASLSKGESSLQNLSPSKHCQTTVQCLKQLGVDIRVDSDKVKISGKGLKGLSPSVEVFDFGESESTLFLLAGILSGLEGEFKLKGDPYLLQRLRERLLPFLEKTGVGFEVCKKDSTLANLRTCGLKTLNFHSDQNDPLTKASLQVASLFTEGYTNFVRAEGKEEKAERLLRLFGARLEVTYDQAQDSSEILDFRKRKNARIQKTNFRLTIEGGKDLVPQSMTLFQDSLLAIFFTVLATLSKKSQISLKNVDAESRNFKTLELLKTMGAEILIKKVKGENSLITAEIIASSSELKGRKIDLPGIEQTFPLLSVIACFSQGTTIIRGLSGLRQGKIDILKSTSDSLRKMGAKIGEMQDGVVIEGKRSLCGAELDGKGNLPLSLGLLLACLLAEDESKLVNHQRILEYYPSLFGLLDLVCCFAN